MTEKNTASKSPEATQFLDLTPELAGEYLKSLTPETELLKLTPELAKEFLMHQSHHSRKCSKKRLAYLCKDLEAGRWVFEGSPIKFNKKGEMIDGQYRCHASIQTGESIPVVCVRGVDGELFNGQYRHQADLQSEKN